MSVRKEKRDTDTPQFRMFNPINNSMIVASSLSLLVDQMHDDEIATVIQTDLTYTGYGFRDCVDIISESEKDLCKYVKNAISYVLEHGPFISAWGQLPLIIEKIEGYCPIGLNGEPCEYLMDGINEYVSEVRAEFKSNLIDYIRHTDIHGEQLTSPTSEVVLEEMRYEAERDMEYYCSP